MTSAEQCERAVQAVCAVLRAIAFDPLQVTAQDAYEVVGVYAAVFWQGSLMGVWYEATQQSEAERQTFFHRWSAWQQAERQRLGLD